MKLAQKIRIIREAGYVERCHGVLHHGSYSVGLHCYNAVSLLLLLHPNPRVELLRAMMWHDMPERFLGDLPAPAKWYNENLNTEYTAAENRVLYFMKESNLMDALSASEKDWLHAIDRLELLMWCDDQEALGNRHIKNLRPNVVSWFMKATEKGAIPHEVEVFLDTYSWDRNKEDIREE